ncbi:uncharacterized protein CANTADRAFT_23311 [Suhomyces tanzawaensis NRRL Y-17324]|uniref:Uncharacterized protein n=1 Tax=Suhomyces tanzawaensis NRRL Y-17324 TaxID=984487 RepID=A0A1E4SFH0_9ASCO|nr:uncharacterized protein CANTADRAFT_23311 [Suhomyces tanzawaensis NRRL Y-17324]ODV78215.1 hypothetical protein CANTADRAFT_23311 [Suhomyces tanzawaensis NRRL Y-17324]
MPLFKSSPKEEILPFEKEHAQEYKMSSNNYENRLLQAVNEAQPFEQAHDHTKDNRRPSYLSQESNNLKDIFGNTIAQGDISNPTRSRNERPLDTIRSFEYAITGDLTYRDQLESHRLGWGFHEDFPYYNLVSGQEQYPQRGAAGAGLDRPVANFGEQAVYQANNYSASSLKPEGKKKKGMFGRKKK